MKIQAAVAWEAGATLSIEEFDLDDPRDDEILVKIEAVGVCHADDNARLGRLPVIVTERNIVPVPADAPLRYLAGFTCGVQKGRGRDPERDPTVFIPRLLELHRQGRFPVDRLVRNYPFAEVNTAIADSLSGATIKPVLTFN